VVVEIYKIVWGLKNLQVEKSEEKYDTNKPKEDDKVADLKKE
jgi:hypothetical protein